MIQDIAPHHYHNEYHHFEIQKGDCVLFYRKQFEVLYAKLADLSEGMDDGNIRIYQIAKEEMQKIAILGNPSCIREDDLDDVVVI